MLDGAGDTERDIQLGRDGLARTADLSVRGSAPEGVIRRFRYMVNGS